MKKNNPVNRPTCNVNNMAKLLNLSVRRVQALVQEGILPKPENGKYDVFGCTHQYIDHIKNRSASASMSKTKDEILQIERDAKALKLAKEKDLYILKSEVGGELVKRIVVLKRDFRILEHKLTKYPKAREIVKDHLRRMMLVYSGKTGVFQDKSNKRTKKPSSQLSTAGLVKSPGSANDPGGLLPGEKKGKRKIQGGK